MENPLIELYETVYDRLNGIDPEKYWFDIDMGQLDKGGKKVPISFPAFLVSFEDICWKEGDSDYQIGLVNLTVKYAHRFKSESELLTGNGLRDEIRECYANVQTMHERLDGVTSSSFSKLTRFNEYHQRTDPKDLLWVHVIQYQCNIQSNGAIASPELLITDFEDVKNNNVFLERRKLSMIYK